MRVNEVRDVVDLIGAECSVVVEGNYGAGKTTLVDELKACWKEKGDQPSVCTDFLIPTDYLDSPDLGQAIYLLHDCLKASFIRAARKPAILERYITSTLAHHYASPTGNLPMVLDITIELFAHGLLVPPTMTVIVLRGLSEVEQVNRLRGWAFPERYLERQDEFFRVIVHQLEVPLGRLKLIDCHGTGTG